MIPVTLITGFLGSGKTTLLRRLTEQYRDRRVAFLVNEFSPTDVDGKLINLHEGIKSIPGGSIFCKCLVTEFIRTMRTVPGLFDNGLLPVEGVIVEASGIADPCVIDNMLKETRLDSLYELTSIVSVVDPGTFDKLLQVLPNIRAQVKAADTILLNKCDLYDEMTLVLAETLVNEINPAARVLRTINADAAIDPLGECAHTGDLTGLYAECSDPRFDTVKATFPSSTTVEELEVAINRFDGHLYRAKGFAYLEGTCSYVDFSSDHLTVTPDKQGTCTGLVLIGSQKLKGVMTQIGLFETMEDSPIVAC